MRLALFQVASLWHLQLDHGTALDLALFQSQLFSYGMVWFVQAFFGLCGVVVHTNSFRLLMPLGPLLV